MRWRSRRRDSVCVDIEVSFARDMAAVHKLVLSAVVRLGSARLSRVAFFLNYHDPIPTMSQVHPTTNLNGFSQRPGAC